ncbi:MAG: DNA ligase D [Candidatus Paceibacterota bacterium]|jgi:bifunctional non-homologous end joining protein LigD|nr:DNA ligase D [Candidatus Paceibacterota bacterium]
MALKKYNKKRDFTATTEPKGITKKGRVKTLKFVVQKHDASHLHYDLRLEMDGAMKSFAVPKGPSLDPSVKRLAMQVEDHPISYNTFEGTIPKGQYGGGSVIVWDNGTYASVKTDDAKKAEKEFLTGLKKGSLHFKLNGQKLQGIFTLVRLKGKEKEWLLIKKDDQYAAKEDVLSDNRSVLSERKLIGKEETKTKSKAKPIKLQRVKPMLAALADKPFSNPDWIFEIKWDGYRAMANIQNGKVDLYSRNFNTFNGRFPKIADKLAAVSESVILDGEIVGYDKKGNVSFQELQNAESAERIEYLIFDIIDLEGNDLTSLSLLERKQILKEFLKNYPELKESEYVEEQGEKFFNLAVDKDLEGIMAKKKDSPYIPNRRTTYWLKIKNHNTEEAVIAGFTEPRGSRKYFGALVLGVYKDKKLLFAGHTGTGFDESTLKSLYGKMKPLIADSSPFKTKVPVNSPITWIRPKLIAQIKFAEWTSEGIIRQAVFLGLREDKDTKEVVAEAPVASEKVVKKTGQKDKGDPDLTLTNLDKIYFPKLQLAKKDVIGYYQKISRYILPYLKDRPESLNRHPNGVSKPSFFQKNFTVETPPFVTLEKIHSESNEEDVNYLVCQNKDTLLYMSNLGCIEINPWNSRIGKLNFPDYMIFDLDPKNSSWKDLVTVALTLKKILDDIGLDSYIKTSGKSGLHVYIPLGAQYDFETVRNFCEMISKVVHEELPDITSLERDPKKRRKKIYLDYLQNRKGQTTASVYSLRPTPDATVSTPLEWKELTPKLDPKKFNIKTVSERIKKIGDIWKPVLTDSADLEKALKNLEKKFIDRS